MTEQNRLVERKEIKLVGFSVTVSLNEDLENGVIEGLRGEFLHKRHDIANQLEHNGIYLIQVYPECEWTPDIPFQSIVAAEVSEFAAVPEGMVEHTLPAGSYARFTHYGPESEIGDTYNYIRETDIASTRAFDFEHWTNVETIGQEKNAIDIYLPLDT